MIFSPSPKNRSRLQLRISERRLVLMSGDALAIVLSVFAALRIWAWVARYPFTIEFVLPQSFWFILFLGVWFVLAGANDFYDLQIASSLSASFQRLILMQLQMLIVYLVIYFLSQAESLPRLFVLYYAVLSLSLIAIWRVVNPALIGWQAFQRRVLVVGTDWAASTIVDAINSDRSQAYKVVGVIGENDEIGQSISTSQVIGDGDDILGLIAQYDVTELVISSTRDLNGITFQGVMDAYERGIAITPMPILYERMTGRVPVKSVNDNWTVVLPLGQSNNLNPYPLLKRLMDLTIAFVLVPPFMLLLPLIALIIKLDSRGPVFYVQTRSGLNGRPFKILKFRTMSHDAEQKTGAVFAQANDPRVTRFGRIMRKTRIDELPQIFNVIRGDMSLVGPRPERPEHVIRLEEKIPFYRTRHVVRPGVTGWAQVRYHYGSTDEDAMVKLQYDLYYIRHQSLGLDVNIIIRTVGKVLRMAGL